MWDSQPEILNQNFARCLCQRDVGGGDCSVAIGTSREEYCCQDPAKEEESDGDPGNVGVSVVMIGSTSQCYRPEGQKDEGNADNDVFHFHSFRSGERTRTARSWSVLQEPCPVHQPRAQYFTPLHQRCNSR